MGDAVKPQAHPTGDPHTEGETLLEVRDLQIHFPIRRGVVKAVNGVSFHIDRGETLGIIGESGCGKSQTARAVLNMVPRPGKVTGSVRLAMRDKLDATKPPQIVDTVELDQDGDLVRRVRGGYIGMLFQEPMSSLTPVYTAGNHFQETLLLHRRKRKTIGETLVDNLAETERLTKPEAREIAVEMLQRVGVSRPKQTVDSYPHELSGGQRQRVMIGIALSCRPDLLIADEPTTALDVSIEAQILELINELRDQFNMATMFITHDLGVIAEVSDRVVVMYMGRVVETGPVSDIFRNPLHPYTQALMQSIPHIGRKSDDLLRTIKGSVPDPVKLPSGCVFHPRCEEFRAGRCDVAEPELIEVEPHHLARCVLYE